MLGEIHVKLDNFTMSLKEQLSFNNRLQNQVPDFKYQVAYHEKVNAVTTRGGKATCDPSYPEPVSKKKSIEVVEVEEEEIPATPRAKVRTNPHELYDTHVLQFPERSIKAREDEQFKKFLEVIQK